MCKSKQRSDAIEPNSTSRSSLPRSSRLSQSAISLDSNNTAATVPSITSLSGNLATTTSNKRSSTTETTSTSTRSSLSSLRRSLLDTTTLIVDYSEICTATDNFIAPTLSASSSTWRCTIRDREVAVSQCKLHRPIETSHIYKRVSSISRLHHNCLIKLAGISVSGDYVYLVYDYVAGSNLTTCLRNPKGPSFTILSTWISRMQIATDIAHGLDYLHNCAHLVHNHIKSSSIIITEPSLRAKIRHFATSDLTGETSKDEFNKRICQSTDQSLRASEFNSSVSQTKRFEGARGYMSPEFKFSGTGSQKSDVFAFGIVMLELLSGEEPLKYEFDESKGYYRRVSVVDTAREVIECGGDHDSSGGGGSRLRRWVDWRLRDSFPVEVARKMTHLALECVEVDPKKRPDMSRVAGKVSRLYLQSKIWSDKMGAMDVSVSLAPR